MTAIEDVSRRSLQTTNAGDATAMPATTTKHAHWAGEEGKEGKLAALLVLHVLRDIDADAPAIVKVQTFKWTSLSMGWYLSMVWGWVYAADAARIWPGTSIRLFNVLSPRNEISLRSPRGAVDAVGDTIARRISSLNFNNQTSMREV